MMHTSEDTITVHVETELVIYARDQFSHLSTTSKLHHNSGTKRSPFLRIKYGMITHFMHRNFKLLA